MDRQGDEPLMEQLRRERLLDMEERIGRVRRQAFAVLSLGVIASGPWIGFAFVIPLALLLAGFGFIILAVGGALENDWAWRKTEKKAEAKTTAPIGA